MSGTPPRHIPRHKQQPQSNSDPQSSEMSSFQLNPDQSSGPAPQNSQATPRDDFDSSPLESGHAQPHPYLEEFYRRMADFNSNPWISTTVLAQYASSYFNQPLNYLGEVSQTSFLPSFNPSPSIPLRMENFVNLSPTLPAGIVSAPSWVYNPFMLIYQQLTNTPSSVISVSPHQPSPQMKKQPNIILIQNINDTEAISNINRKIIEELRRIQPEEGQSRGSFQIVISYISQHITDELPVGELFRDLVAFCPQIRGFLEQLKDESIGSAAINAAASKYCRKLKHQIDMHIHEHTDMYD